MHFSLSLKNVVSHFLVYILCLIDWVNERYFSNKQLQACLVSEVRQLLFQVKGYCQHSGHCCHHIAIKVKGRWLTQRQDFNAVVKKNPIFSRFIPIFRQGSQQAIHAYNCSARQHNRCIDYHTRPDFCRRYPYNVIVKGDAIHEGCGFYVSQVRSLPRFATQALKKKTWLFLFNQPQRQSIS